MMDLVKSVDVGRFLARTISKLHFHISIEIGEIICLPPVDCVLAVTVDRRFFLFHWPTQ